MRHRVVVTREGDNWLADAPDLEGTHTFARTLPNLDQSVREAVVLATGQPEDAMSSLEFDWQFRTGDSTVDGAAAELRDRRRVVSQMTQDAMRDTEALAIRLAAAGYSVRDIAWLTGISHQRVSQLTSKAG